MREANAVLRDLEAEFLDHEVDTATLVIRWVDKLREEYEAHERASEANRRAFEEMRYYGLYETELYTDGINSSRVIVAHHRIKPDEFKAFCKQRGLDEGKLKSVAVGEVDWYGGFKQASWNGYMIGKEYRRPKEVDVFDVPAKKPKSVPLFSKPQGKPYPADSNPRGK